MMNSRQFLKEATRLKKSGNILKAIECLEKAYTVGDFESASSNSNDPDNNEGLNNFYTIEDLVRKAKYLQELGKIKESLNFLDNLIKETTRRTKNNVWEIFELGRLFQHRAIILKKEKKFNQAFIDIVKSYCIDGIATRLTAPVKPKSQPENEYDKLKLDSYKSDIKRIQNIIANKTNQKFILDYLENDLKKISVKIDKYRLAAFIMKTIMFENDTSKVLKGVVTYLKL